MTSTWKEPSDDRPGSELLNDRDTAAPADASSGRPADQPRDFIDRGMSDADELHRLEESIRWLMNAGTGAGRDEPLDLGPLDAGVLDAGALEPPSPRRAPPEPGASVRNSSRLPIRRQGSALRAAGQPAGLRILDGDDDALRLDPDTLFVPQQRRRGSFIASVAKVVVVSAIAAPSAYFVANWLQAPRPPVTTADSQVITTPVALGDDQADAATAMTASTKAADDPEKAPGAARTTTADAPVAMSPDIELRADATPADGAAPTEIAMPPPATTAPPRPPVSAQEAAQMIDRGNSLFEAGDIISARLLFRRAAQAGNAAGATALARSYDPDVLARQMLGAAADEQEAQRWYARARELGDHDSGKIALH